MCPSCAMSSLTTSVSVRCSAVQCMHCVVLASQWSLPCLLGLHRHCVPSLGARSGSQHERFGGLFHRHPGLPLRQPTNSLAVLTVSPLFSFRVCCFVSAALRMMALCDDAICNQWRKYRAKLQQQQPMAPDSGSVSVSPRSAWRQQQLQPSASEAAGIEASRAQAVLKARHGCHRAFDIFFGVSFAALGAAFFVSALTLTATQHAHCQDAVSEAVWSRASPKVFWPDGLLFWSPRCDFAAVHQLSLSGAGLQTLLPSIALLSQLENLTISDNQLTALPLELGNIASLRRLDARDNLIANLPAALAAQWSERSRPLQQLLLDGNPAAEYLDWSFSGLRSVPTVVTQLADTLRSLSLRGNDLTSFESSTLLKLSLLEQLDISQNRIPQVPVAIVPSLPAMRVFNASDAGLTDTLPDNVSWFAGLFACASLCRFVLFCPPAPCACLPAICSFCSASGCICARSI